MRPGRPDDLPALRALIADEVRRGVRDSTPTEMILSRIVSSFDWETRSRVIEDAAGPRAMVLVLEHPRHGNPVVRVETAAGGEADRLRLLRWGVGLSRAVGAAVAQVWQPRGLGTGVAELGLTLARPFWRMDRPHLERLPAPELAPGYRLAPSVDRRTAVEVFNVAFSEHWRFQRLDPEHLPPFERPPDLDLLALSANGEPAAVVWCSVERHEPDPRPQPVGMIEVVGTVPEHRRRGLAHALTAEALRRLRRRGARSGSLYVDALNPTRAFDVYGRLGFVVAFQYDVLEVVLR